MFVEPVQRLAPVPITKIEAKAPNGRATHRFDIDPRSRECLLKGIDEIEYTLTQIDAIRAFERRIK